MPASAIDDNHPIIENHDLDPEMVRRILKKFVSGTKDDDKIYEDVADVLDIDPRDDARELVWDYREPDWPIEYHKEFRVNSVDVYENFKYSHDGYEPSFARDFGVVTVTWEIDEDLQPEIIRVNGHEFPPDQESV